MQAKSFGLRKGIAAFGASAMLFAALTPAMAFGAVDPSVQMGDPVDPATGASSEVWLSVNDGGATTMSVTAPLKIYLAVDLTANDLENDTYLTEKYEFKKPSASVVTITNNSANTKVALSAYGVRDNNRGKAYKSSDTAAGFYTRETADSTSLARPAKTAMETAAQSADTFWLTGDFTGAGNTVAGIDLATVASGVSLSSHESDLTMDVPTTNNNKIEIDLNGEIYGPSNERTSYGAAEGARLNTLTWTFRSINS